MRKANVVIGECYTAKVSGKVQVVRIDRESRYSGWEATNIFTDRRVRIKTAGRLRLPVPELAVAKMVQRAKMLKVYKKEKVEGEAREALKCDKCGK